jgi:hypothetical protein
VNLLAFPKPQPCHACEHKFVGAVCPTCKTERPSFTALKNMTAREHRGVQPVRSPAACKYYPDSLCGCGQRGTCLEAA